MATKPSQLFRFPHPQSRIEETFEAINVLGAHVELRAITGNYPNDLARTVNALDVDIRRHRLLNQDEIRLLEELSESPRGRTISGNKRHDDLDELVQEKLATAKAVSLEAVLYEITESGRRVLATQAGGAVSGRMSHGS